MSKTIKQSTTLSLIICIIITALSIFNTSLFPPKIPKAQAATEEIGLVRQDCTGYSNCFTSLSAWEAAYGGIDFTGCTVGDLTCVDKIAVAQIDGAWTAPDITAVTIDGWATDATRYIRIYTTEEARHDGKWNTGKYRIELGSSAAITIQEDYVIVDGLQILQSSSDASYNRSFLVSGQNVSNEITISNCILKAEASGTANNWDVVRTSDADLIIKFYNNIAYDWVNGANTMNGFRVSGLLTAYIYNNTFINIYSYGFNGGSGTVIAKNNITQNCPDGFFSTFHASSDYNISDIEGDTTGISSSYREGLVTDVSFVDEDGDDFHLSVSDTSAKDQGTDLSADPNLAFTDDIDGNTRPINIVWDIGADEVLPTIHFTTTSSTNPESIASTDIELTLSETYGSDVTVDYTLTGTATGSETDYILTNGTATISSGTTTNITPTIIDDDLDEIDETIILTLSSPVNAILGSNTVHTYTITDDDTAGITITPTSGLTTTEAGATTTFTAVLDTEPTADVSFGITSSDTTEGTVAPASLTFTSGNWDTPQTVTITGVDDDLQDGDIAYTILNATSTSADGNYNVINPTDVSVTNTDNDTAGITITESSNLTNLTEGSTTDTYTIVLDSEPTNNVIITITPDADSTVDSSTITFTSSNWETEQTITITAVDDTEIETDHTSVITHTSASDDSNYDGLTISSITANITDNDFAGGGFISPAPPIVSLLPNQSFEIITIDNQATINLSNIENVHQIAISTTPDFKSVSWEPYKENIVLPDVEKVYLKFRSQTGGVSEVYEIEIDLNDETNFPDLSNGSLVRAINDYKVYIINNIYRRHIIDEIIFSFYNHLNWNAVQEIDSSQLNNYKESYLIRELNDHKVYEIKDNKKHWLAITEEEFIERGYNWDEVFVVNEAERDFYEMGEDL